MSVKRRRELDREKMRRRILDAAKQLFVREGFDNVSLRRIATVIDYSPAAIYRYFKNKREILSVLRNEGFERFIKGQERRREQYADPVERLRQGGKDYIRFALDEPEYYQLMFSTSCDQVDLEGEYASNSIKSYNNLHASVAECVASGHFGKVDVDTVVFTLWSTVHGLAHLVSTGQVQVLSEAVDFDILLDSIIRFNIRPGQ